MEGGIIPPFPRPRAEDRKKPDLDSFKAETAEFGQVNRIHLDTFSYKLNFIISLNFKLALTQLFFQIPLLATNCTRNIRKLTSTADVVNLS